MTKTKTKKVPGRKNLQGRKERKQDGKKERREIK
jgi:hypothetical protein